jgi:hypothetical protein
MGESARKKMASSQGIQSMAGQTTTKLVRQSWWVPYLHFGVAATGVVASVSSFAGIIPVPGVGVAGVVLTALAGPVAHYLGRKETELDSGKIS